MDRRRNIRAHHDAFLADPCTAYGPDHEAYACLFPETLGRWNYHNDPLVENEEPTTRFEAWDIADPYSTVR